MSPRWCLAAAVVLWSANGLANPWVRAQGGGYAKFGLSYARDNGFWDNQGTLQSSNTFRGITADAFADLSPFEDVGLTVYLPVSLRGLSDDIPSTNPNVPQGELDLGLSNLELGLRTAVLKQSLAASVEVLTSVPLTDGTSQPLHTDRVWSFALRGHLGKGFHVLKRQAYTSMMLGYVQPVTFGPSLNDFVAPSLAAAFELGMFLIPRLMFKLRMDARFGLTGLTDAQRDRPRISAGFATTPEFQDALEPSVGMAWFFGSARKHGVEGYAKAPIYAKNRGRGFSTGVGVFTSW